MSGKVRPRSRLSGADLDFLVSSAAPEARDAARLKQVIAEDEDFRNAFLDDDRTVRRAISDRDVFLKISPGLYFEILLRNLRRELSGASHTLEGGRFRKVAVFDAGKVVDLLSRTEVLLYLADMLASFTRVESGSFTLQLRGRAWRRIRFNDADVDGLVHSLEFAGEEYRFHFCKRIADICLFLLGVFPEYARASCRYPLSGEARPRFAGYGIRSPEEYEKEGKKYYRLAAEHTQAKDRELSEVFHLLHDGFQVARKPLALIAEKYIRPQRSPHIPE